MRKLLLLIFLLPMVLISIAQTAGGPNVSDSVTKAKAKASKDSMINAFAAKAKYPLIKSSKWTGVIPVENVDEKPDTIQQYKLLMEVTEGMKDSTEANEMNPSFQEVGRLLNIHIASGIPLKNINMVVVAHGPVLEAFYNDTIYREKYKMDNPNIPLLKELLDAGVKFIACGQAMYLYNIKREEMLPFIKVSLSAQTVLTSYQLKGYVYKHIVTD